MENELTTNEIHYCRDRHVVLYRRERSGRWQARFKLKTGVWHRFSTSETELKRAKEVACETFDHARFKQKEGRSGVSKRFDSIAKQAIAEMQELLENDLGKKVYTDYISAIKNHLIPYFGNKHIDNIGPEEYRDYQQYLSRRSKKQLPKSTITTHNTALNRIFDIAVTNGWLGKSQVPILKNKGAPSARRPAFTYEEYMLMVRRLGEWVKGGYTSRSKQIRVLLRDYVLILANTGIRTGTESDKLKWKHIAWHTTKSGDKYLVLTVDGKTKGRSLIARHNCVKYFKRIQERFPELHNMSFDELLQAKVDEYVFRLENGERTRLNQNFEQFLTENDLLEDPASGQNRTLYSLRHTYATFALTRDNLSIHDLAMQMGTSIKMIEDHYNHLEPVMKARQLAGDIYE